RACTASPEQEPCARRWAGTALELVGEGGERLNCGRGWGSPQPFHPRNCGRGRGSPLRPALPPGRPPHPCPAARVGERRAKLRVGAVAARPLHGPVGTPSPVPLPSPWPGEGGRCGEGACPCPVVRERERSGHGTGPGDAARMGLAPERGRERER